ncbi:MAG: transcription-repair coupling factor [Mariprofundaceae bacterium]|nr:transcription-repair coupling factor [Mariprofundaceae bacterium]
MACQLATLARESGLSVYICPDLRSYRQLAEEISFFLQDAPHLLWRFPAWEVLPYDRVSPHHTIVGERFATLGRLLADPAPRGLLLTALPAWLQRIAPPSIVAAHVWQLKVGEPLDIATLKQRLSEAGMHAAERVLAPGEFAARGGLLDIWPATEDAPLRIDLFGDEIESIRRFDIETQRSGEHLQQFVSVPVREVILDATGRETFTAAFRARFPQHRRHPMLAAAQAGRPHPGIESLLSLAYAETARLTDYLPAEARIHAPEDIEQKRLAFAEQVRAQFDMVRLGDEPVISPQELYATETAVEAAAVPAGDNFEAAPSLADYQHHARPLHALQRHLADRIREGWRLLLVAHGPGQQERMIEACSTLAEHIPRCAGLHDMPDAPVSTAIGFLDAGLVLPEARILLLTGRELLGQRLPRRRGRSRAAIRADVFSSLQELKPGDPVVHEDHGIGRYRGLSTIEADGVQTDFLHIEYAGDASIYVPVEELDRLHRYTGEDEPRLNKPGSEKWKRTRERVKHDLLAMAHELVDTEAARQRVTRPPYRLEGTLHDAYEEFSARFPFEETDDQVEAIDQVLRDLASDRPMDRVICGDVGFGKTEVAMRAAFIVAKSGRQVALLAPTTVLANQHFNSFSERFADTGLKVALLSRLQGKAESTRIRDGLASGDIRIIIGTHRLLSDMFTFADLGLVIVDEEQRFGVRHKEKLKQLHHHADLLTLTATPIPRTLHQTLSGLRSVSIISTPPAEREAIRTMVSVFDPHLAKEAIRRELYRGGQIYYLHNHVKSIERIARFLRDEIPEAEIGIAHGQMNPAELDRQMMAFYEGRLHILVCTTIVESGLDVPNANTLIVERADLLGLAQLHQIRGRVGRSHQQAYAYLFTPDPRAMTPDARERLQAIAEHSELGAGFLLARQDMEIRGAGNLLGAEQSGRIEAIGLDLYLDMLTEAVAEARGERAPPPQPCDIHLEVNAILPPEYIPQVGERLAMYRHIARTRSDDDITALFDEMTDRFGRMPPEARHCLEAARIRWRTRAMVMTKLTASEAGIRMMFTERSPIEPARLLARVQREPSRFALKPDGSLMLLDAGDDPDARIHASIAFLDELLKDAGVEIPC